MARKEVEKVRGVYEYPKGSGVWWIHYYDHGRRHRERVGPRKLAIAVRDLASSSTSTPSIGPNAASSKTPLRVSPIAR